MRTALGASRGRIVRYLLAESALLAIGAAAVGLALAWSGIGLLRELATDYVPRSQEIALDGATGWLLLALTLTSGLLFGLVPALHGTGGPVDEALRAWGRSSTGTVSVRRLRRILVGSQFAIATPLLIVAGLLLVSLHQLARVDLGFDTRNLITGSIIVPNSTYREPGRVVAYWDQLQTRVEALPGVAAVAYSDGVPPNIVDDFNNFDLEDFPAAPGQSQPVTPWVGVSPEYFSADGTDASTGTRVRQRGRQQARARKRHRRRGLGHAVLSQHIRGRQAVQGGRLHDMPVDDGRRRRADREVRGPRQAGRGHGLLADPGPRRSRRSTKASRASAISSCGRRRIRRRCCRCCGGPCTISIRRCPSRTSRPIDDLVGRALDQPRSLSILVAGFALVALLLSVVGIYGVMAYYVQQHAKDIGIRVALGGRPRSVRGTDRRPGHDRRGGRRRDRPGRGAADRAPALVTAVRRRGGRRDDVRRCHGHAAGDRTRRLLGARPARGGSRTGGGAAQRVGADQDTLPHVRRVVELGQEKVGHVGASNPWESAEREAFAHAAVAGRGAIDQSGGVHERPVQAAGTERSLAELLVAVDVLQQQTHEDARAQAAHRDVCPPPQTLR